MAEIERKSRSIGGAGIIYGTIASIPFWILLIIFLNHRGFIKKLLSILS